METLKKDPLIQETGARLFLGMGTGDAFRKTQVQVSYMDAHEVKHYFCTPTHGHCPKEGSNEAMTDTRVFCGTTASLNACPWLFALKHFHLAIVDEASQILEPHIIGLLSMQTQGVASIGKVVLIGDHKQLPAVVQQTEEEASVTDEGLRTIGLTDCRLSLFERLLSRFRTADGYDPRFVYMLTRQGRMHSSRISVPSSCSCSFTRLSMPKEVLPVPGGPMMRKSSLACLARRARVLKLP